MEAGEIVLIVWSGLHGIVLVGLNQHILIETSRCSALGVNSQSLLSKNYPCDEKPAIVHLCGSNDHSQVV